MGSKHTKHFEFFKIFNEKASTLNILIFQNIKIYVMRKHTL